ncbi:YbhB/YbcL family Raf kinase inhibitor-like protein [Actinomadura sp. KC216]|uniref:YbhB/YbcL family Raf kinase inhibitor-like protein n=1 Tax=Actinomadura sp. KC216 TaxID=2530370 RepID=UPI001A9E9EF9|nr:YbhB/YbcL family Raf kinase inhibitor-like protein [Actinomadura sp. KC216]
MTIKRVVLSALLVVCAGGSTVAAATPPSSASPDAGPAGAALAITSTAFTNGGRIPIVHECTSSGDNDPRKKNESPPLAWTGGPAETQSYAIIMRDVDNRNLLHWIIYDIPATVAELPQNVEHVYKPTVPAGSRQIYYRGSASLFGYQGPCSPSSVNTYTFTVYALNRATLTELNENSTIQTAANSITRASLGSAVISGES